MKMHNWIFAMAMGLFLQGALLACAGAGDMQADDMRNAPMKEMKTENTRMHDSQMQAPGMKDNTMMDEKMAAPMAVMLTGSEGHKAAGEVSFARQMGRDVLVLSDLKVEKVPDGHVYLARHGDRTQGIDLGILKQFTGNVTFALPAMAHPDDFDSVIIYCEKYQVEIGRAKLERKM